MKKRAYQQPKIKVVELDPTAILAGSDTEATFGIKGNEGFTEEEW